MKPSFYIIGDVHGCISTLKALVNQLPKKEHSRIIFTGDLVGKGLYSAQVLEWIIQHKYTAVKGNHEQKMYDACFYQHSDLRTFSKNKYMWYEEEGGDKILESYEYYGSGDLMNHLLWIKNLPYYIEINHTDNLGKKLFVSHGFGLPFYQRRETKSLELMTNRISRVVYKDYEKECWEYPIFNVFGHDPQKNVIITEHFAAIDTGCVYYTPAIPTYLTAFEWPSKRESKKAYIEEDYQI